MTSAFVTLMGGLGNQLFQYAAAVSCDSEEIILVPEIGSPRQTQGIEDIFAYDLGTGTRRFQFSNSNRVIKKVFNFILRINLVVEKNRISTMLVGFANWIFTCLLTLGLKKRIAFAPGKGIGYTHLPKPDRKTLYLHGYFQSATYLSRSNTYDRMKSLTLTNPSERLDSFKIRAAEQKPIVVHVRRGDYRYEDNFGLLGPKYYQLAFEYLRSQNKIETIWLFSDEPDYALTLMPAEYLALVEVIPVLDEHPASTLELMRLGSAYVIANSSFSWWAAILSKNNKPLVVAPNKWFKNQDSPIGLIPEHWKVVDSNFHES